MPSPREIMREAAPQALRITRELARDGAVRSAALAARKVVEDHELWLRSALVVAEKPLVSGLRRPVVRDEGVLTPWRSAVAAGLITLALGASTAVGVAVAGPAAPTPSGLDRGAAVAGRGPRRSEALRQGRVAVPLVARFGRDRTHLLVTRVAIRKGVRWAEVLLPKRPNGSRGWVLQDRMELTSTSIRLKIDVSDRRLSVFRKNRRIMYVPVAVGKDATPTPTGRWFAIAESLRGTPGGFLGTFILPITGFSETLNEFAGGDGRGAIHGTTLPALIGTQASHGCVRMYNSDVNRLARLARPGTPLAISS